MLPHGNSDVERVFSNLSDVLQKKRQRLDPSTTKALVVARSCLTVKGWTAATVPISPDFLDLAASAHATSVKRREEQRRREEMERREAMENELQSKIEEEKKKNKRISDLSETEMCLDKDYTKMIEERQRKQKLIAELTASAEKTDVDLERLRQEKAVVQRKRAAENEKVVQSVLKRFVRDSC